ncbi:extracellular serine proteinase-like [Saccoglossus kowalevskii]
MVNLLPVIYLIAAMILSNMFVFYQGLLFVFNNGKTPAVINLSINSVTPDILDAFSKLIIRNVLKKRIPIVSSAGNNNDDAGNYYPADSGMVMVVGATDENDKRAPDSNFGPSIDFFAPGVNIETAGIGSDTETVTTSGTSMAAAFVSGLAGLVKTQVPGSTQEEVAHRIGYYTTKDVVDDVNGSPNRLFYACHP